MLLFTDRLGAMDMSQQLIDSKIWLDPLLPDAFPPSILQVADRIPFSAGVLSGRLADPTAQRIAALLRVTNTYYSNLIEGQYTEPALMAKAQSAPKKDKKRLGDLASQHLLVQARLEAVLRRHPSTAWQTLFSPALVQAVHRRLFAQADDEALQLGDGTRLVGGELRSRTAHEVRVGNHCAPAAKSVETMLKHMETGYGRANDPRRKLLAIMAYHHRLAWVHPFSDGNGRVIRMMSYLQLTQLGLASPLWSLSRGLARRQREYYRHLALADKPRQGDLDGRGQLSQKGFFGFIEFMLDVCEDQISYMKGALDIRPLGMRLERLFGLNERMRIEGIRPQAAKAVHALIVQGTLQRAHFKDFTGLGARIATEQLSKLLALGIVESPTPKSRDVHPGFPIWFAQDLFPDLHRRFES